VRQCPNSCETRSKRLKKSICSGAGSIAPLIETDVAPGSAAVLDVGPGPLLMVTVEPREVLPVLEVEGVLHVMAGHQVRVGEHEVHRVDPDADAAHWIGGDHHDLRIHDRVGGELAPVVALEVEVVDRDVKVHARAEPVEPHLAREVVDTAFPHLDRLAHDAHVALRGR
jgi:hypothetical protein